MEVVRDRWTDERLDDLNVKVDDGFRRVDERFNKVDDRFDRLEAKFEARFNRMDERMDGLHRAILYGALTLSGAMLSGFVAMFVLIATRL